MNCHDSHQVLQRRLDGEVVPSTAELDRHLGACPACRRRFANVPTLLRGVAELSRPMVGPDFAESIVARVLKDRGKRRLSMRRRVWAITALAACLLLMILADHFWSNRQRAPVVGPFVEKKPPQPPPQHVVLPPIRPDPKEKDPKQNGSAVASDPLQRPKGSPEITNSIGMKLALIPSGAFLMGAPDADDDAEEHEKPQHKVRITKPFFLGVHEVTVGQFRAFVDATGYRTGAEIDGQGSGYNAVLRGFEYGMKEYSWKKVGWKQDDDHPVLNVTWQDALSFCRWLSKKENKIYRLPTEAEWEYACRGGTTTRFFSGDNLEDTEKVANVLDQSLIDMWEAAARDLRQGKAQKYNVPMKWNDSYPFTAPVGRFRANAYGLHDMHGNAAEWCDDRYDKDYYRNSPSDDPAGAASSTTRVVRGGTFLANPRLSRASMRGASFPHYRSSAIGFRVVLTSP